MDYPVGLIKSSVKGNEGMLAVFDLGECIGLCRFKFKKQRKEVILLNLELKAFVDKEDVFDSIAEWLLNQDGVVLLEYHPDI